MSKIETKEKKPYTHLDTEQEKYRHLSSSDPWILAQKQKVREAVAQKGLTSMMNDTKWLELQKAIETLPFPPPYIEKLVLDGQGLYKKFSLSDAPTYLGDWGHFYEEGMSLFFAIEWINVCPRHARHKGQLIPPEILDETVQFEQILKHYHIPYEEENGTFTIYGYK